MDALNTIFSAGGRLAPKPFMLSSLAVYAAGFLSQWLLSSTITQRAHVIPFVLVQIAVAWTWYALHAQRLRDAGRGVGAAAALILFYALAVAFLLVMVLTAHNLQPPTDTNGFVIEGIVAVLLVALLTSLIIGASSTIDMFGPASLARWWRSRCRC